MTASEQNPPWYLSAFDRSYLQRYRHRDDAEAGRQIDFLERTGLLPAGPLPGGCRVLDLCCGAGRHALQLARRGARPIGVDLSHDLLRVARPLPLARADMRRLPFLDGGFDLVIQMFTAFGYFAEDKENQSVLAEVARVLAPGGRYVLDLMNRIQVVRTLVPESTDTREDGTIVRQQRRFDPRAGRIEKRIVETEADGRELHRFESVRLFDREEITAWLSATHMEVLSVRGRFDESEFDPEQSERLIVISRKASR